MKKRYKRTSLRGWAVAGVLAFGLAAPASASAAFAPPYVSAPAVQTVAAAAAGGLASGAGEAAPEQDALARAVRGWIAELAEQQAFRAWRDASSRTEALGPGTHGWLVTLLSPEPKPVAVGYMVVYAKEGGGFALGEYGLGPQPLFDRTALSRSLVANGLIESHHSSYEAEKRYLHPFAAAWKVSIGGESYWFDAKTAEQLPLDDAMWERLAKQAAGSAGSPAACADRSDGNGAEANESDGNDAVAGESNVASGAETNGTAGSASLRLNEPFDPYERLPWLQNEPAFDVAASGSFAERMDAGKPLRFVTEPFGDRMLYALAVVGYLAWGDGRLDAALDMCGTRFIPLEQLRTTGLFYR